jgi:hypothetical protein
MAAKRRTRISCQYVSAMFSAAISMLADWHSDQRQLFWGPMWICVSVCEYLVIGCDKTTFQELNDYHVYMYFIIYIFRLIKLNICYINRINCTCSEPLSSANTARKCFTTSAGTSKYSIRAYCPTVFPTAYYLIDNPFRRTPCSSRVSGSPHRV